MSFAEFVQGVLGFFEEIKTFLFDFGGIARFSLNFFRNHKTFTFTAILLSGDMAIIKFICRKPA